MLEIRKQGEILSEYLTPGQLTSLFQTLVMMVVSVFSLCALWIGTWMAWGRPEHGYLIVTYLFGVGFLLIRLYVKFTVAQRITNAVRC